MASYVALPLANGSTLYVNPETVDNIEDAPGIVPPACFVSFTGENSATRVTALGTAAAVSAALAAGGPLPVPASAGNYAPALASAPVAPLLNVFFSNNWQFQQLGTVVTITGRFTFDFSAPGFAFAEFTLPAGPPAPAPGDTTGGGAAVVFLPPPVGQVDGLAATFKGIGPTGALRFELYDPTGLLVGNPASCEFAVSYQVP